MLISSISDFPCGSAGKKSTHNAGDIDQMQRGRAGMGTETPELLIQSMLTPCM